MADLESVMKKLNLESAIKTRNGIEENVLQVKTQNSKLKNFDVLLEHRDSKRSFSALAVLR